jgi:hypothetical protein
MPAPPAAASASSYVPPKYHDPDERPWWRSSLAYGVPAIALIVAGLLILNQLTTRPPSNTAGFAPSTAMIEPAPADGTASAASAGTGSSQPAQPAAGKIAPGESSDAWIGTLVLTSEHATLKIRTVPDDSIEARQFAATFQESASLARLSIDNSGSKDELVVDTSHATLQFADGSDKPVLDAMKVYSSSRRDASGTGLKLICPPYHVPGGADVAPKTIFLPKGTDPRRLKAIVLTVNGSLRTVEGEFVDAAMTQRSP